MNFYLIKVALSAEPNQQDIIDLLKNAQAEVIQTNDGLCVKSAKSVEGLKATSRKLKDISFETFQPSKNDSTDLTAFISKP